MKDLSVSCDWPDIEITDKVDLVECIVEGGWADLDLVLQNYLDAVIQMPCPRSASYNARFLDSRRTFDKKQEGLNIT